MHLGGRSVAILMTGLLAAVAMAGCTSDGEPANDESNLDGIDVTATQNTGVVRGVVVDAAIRPLAGAAVSLLLPDADPMKATSNDAGAFGFSDVPPGTYFVEAGKPGYITVRQSVEVVAGVDTPPAIKLLLESDPASLPFIEVYQWNGFIECSFSLVIVRFAACSGVGNDNFLVEYPLSAAPDWVQSEMVWESTQALGDEMQLSITDFSGPVQVRINASAGPSPVLVTVNKTTAAEFGMGVNNTAVWRVFNDALDATDVVPAQEVQDVWASTLYPVYNSTAPQPVKDELDFLLTEECIKYPTLFDACLGAGGVGATIQQEFTVYTHVFYRFSPEPGWRFTADGDHPAPTA